MDGNETTILPWKDLVTIIQLKEPGMNGRLASSSSNHSGVPVVWQECGHQSCFLVPNVQSFCHQKHRSSWWVIATHMKKMLVKLDHFPKDRGENEKSYLTIGL